MDKPKRIIKNTTVDSAVLAATLKRLDGDSYSHEVERLLRRENERQASDDGNATSPT